MAEFCTMENCTAHDIYMKEDIYLDMMQQGIHLYVKCKLGKLHKAVVYEEYKPNILSDYSRHEYHDNYSYFEEDNNTKRLPRPKLEFKITLPDGYQLMETYPVKK